MDQHRMHQSRFQDFDCFVHFTRNCKCHIYKILTFSSYIHNIKFSFTRRNSFTNLLIIILHLHQLQPTCLYSLFVSANVLLLIFTRTFLTFDIILHLFWTKVNIKLFIFERFKIKTSYPQQIWCQFQTTYDDYFAFAAYSSLRLIICFCTKRRFRYIAKKINCYPRIVLISPVVAFSIVQPSNFFNWSFRALSEWSPLSRSFLPLRKASTL